MSGRLWRPGFAVTLMREDAPQREHSLREVFNGLRYIVHTGMVSA
jgi:hypothetical protein